MSKHIFKFFKTPIESFNTLTTHFPKRAAFNSIPKQKRVLGAAVASLMLYTTYHFQPTKTKIRLEYHEDSEYSDLVTQLSNVYDQHFRPNFFLAWPLMQFVMLKNPPEGAASIIYDREYLKMKDGGQVALDWTNPVRQMAQPQPNVIPVYESIKPSDDNKILFVLHGLTGGSEAGYIKTLVHEANKKGFRVVCFNNRGVNQPLLTPEPYHGGYLGDIEAAVDHVRNKFPKAPIYFSGLSFGGNQLIRYLADAKDKTNFVAATGLAVPFDIESCLNSIENTVYELFFLKRYLTANVMPHLDVLKQLERSHGINMEEVLKIKRLRDFHHNFTARVFGHKSVTEYFDTSKLSEEIIKKVDIPLFLLHARDDPIALYKDVRIDWLKANPNIIYAETAHGAHLCWFSGLMPKRWYAEPTLEFIELIEKKKSLKDIHAQDLVREDVVNSSLSM